VEEVVLTVPEDAGEIGEEGLEVDLLNLLVVRPLVDEGENLLTCFARVRPLPHFDRECHLNAPNLKKFDLDIRRIWVIKSDWIWNLEVLLVWELFGLLELLEVSVENIGQILVLFLAMELEAELKEVLSNFVVQMEELGILSERIHDNLCDLRVEVDPGDDLQFLDDFFKVTIGKEDELFRACFSFLDVGDRAILLILLVTLAE